MNLCFAVFVFVFVVCVYAQSLLSVTTFPVPVEGALLPTRQKVRHRVKAEEASITSDVNLTQCIVGNEVFHALSGFQLELPIGIGKKIVFCVQQAQD